MSQNGYSGMTLKPWPILHDHYSRKLLDEVKVQHGASFWLSAWVNNQKATDFYQKYGFKNVGELNFELEGELHQNHVFCYSDALSTQILK